MRPKYLVMEAFGSYGRRTEIDFTHPKQDLFLITGDTGSGKSTIFKAIVFALYGRATSGDARKNEADFQSNFASENEAPYVSLTFTVGKEDEEYRIERRGSYWHTTKTGKKTRRPEQKTLFLPDGTEYPSKEIDSKIESLIGLTREQFMQVVMIAQGEFMKVVRAESNTRRDIFRRLFGTEKYSYLTQRLKDMRSEQEGRMKEYRAKIQALLATVRISDVYPEKEFGDELRMLLNLLLQEEELSSVDVTDAMERIHCFNESLEGYSHELKEKKDLAAEKADQALRLLTNAQHLEQIFLRLEAQEEKKRELLGRKQEMDVKEQLYKSILESLSWKKVAVPLEETAHDLEQSLRMMKESEDLLPQAASEAKEAEKRASERKQALDEAEEKTRVLEEKVRESKRILTRREELTEDIRREEGRIQKAADAYRDFRAKYDALEEERQKGEARLDELGDTGAALLKASAEEQAFSDAYAKKDRVIAIKEELKDADEEAREAERNYLEKMARFSEQERRVSADRKALLDEQAGILAQSLQEGEPCPVCGSKEHPHLAVPTGEVPSKERLEQEEEDLRNNRAKMEKLSLLAGEKKSMFLRKQEQEQEAIQAYIDRVASLNATASDMQPSSLEEADTLLYTILGAWKQTREKLEIDHEEALRIKKDLEAGVTKRRDFSAQIEEEEKAQAASEAAKRAYLEQLEHLEKPPYEDLKEAEALLRSSSEEAERKAAESNRAAKEQQEKNTLVTTLQSRIESENQRLPELRNRLAEREAAADEWKKEHAMTPEQAEQFLKEHTEDEAEALRKACTAYQEELTKLHTAMEENRRLIEGQQRPNLAVLQEEKDRLTEEKTSAVEHYHEMIRDLDGNRRAEDSLKKLWKSREKDSKRYDAVQSLYRSLSGQKTGARMDIETYVQRRYLSDILLAANERFTKMTGGQFDMRMESLEKAGEGKNRGLDLIIYSAVTGKEREISSLSGGESFMAALSLALGIGDSIQARAMSIPLDIMFIDEGFGSLDSTSLGQAVRVLQEMAGNQKLIGIISHVEALKQVTDDQLVITKDESGSRAKWA